jgi:hypothetical protein
MQNDVTFAVITAVLLKIQLWCFVFGRVVGDVSGVSFCLQVGSKRSIILLEQLDAEHEGAMIFPNVRNYLPSDRVVTSQKTRFFPKTS